jgi:hypothetical protein
MRFHRNEVHAEEEVNDPYLQGSLSALFQVRLEGFKGSILALLRCFKSISEFLLVIIILVMWRALYSIIPLVKALVFVSLN